MNKIFIYTQVFCCLLANHNFATLNCNYDLSEYETKKEIKLYEIKISTESQIYKYLKAVNTCNESTLFVFFIYKEDNKLLLGIDPVEDDNLPYSEATYKGYLTIDGSFFIFAEVEFTPTFFNFNKSHIFYKYLIPNFDDTEVYTFQLKTTKTLNKYFKPLVVNNK